jgi:hypothetical protein
MDVRLAIGDDDELIVRQLRRHQVVKCLLVPHRLPHGVAEALVPSSGAGMRFPFVCNLNTVVITSHFTPSGFDPI